MSDLAIVLPGRGYTAIGPAIRFSTLAAEEAGYRPSLVEYPAEAIRAQDLSAVERAVRRQVAEAIRSGEAERVAVIAKSLGTRMVVRIADLLSDVRDVSVVWLTPLFGDPEIRDRAITSGWRSLIVYGDRDPFHDEAGVSDVAGALNAAVVELPGADHALEVPGDVLATISGLRDVAVEVRRFLGAEAQPPVVRLS